MTHRFYALGRTHKANAALYIFSGSIVYMHVAHCINFMITDPNGNEILFFSFSFCRKKKESVDRLWCRSHSAKGYNLLNSKGTTELKFVFLRKKKTLLNPRSSKSLR